jgi:hypothetical protein
LFVKEAIHAIIELGASICVTTARAGQGVGEPDALKATEEAQLLRMEPVGAKKLFEQETEAAKLELALVALANVLACKTLVAAGPKVLAMHEQSLEILAVGAAHPSVA